MQIIFSHHPGSKYGGGWTVVDADGVDQAIAIYRIFHPDINPPMLDCSGIFTENTFIGTKMHRQGNYGKRAVERITLTRMEMDDVSK